MATRLEALAAAIHSLIDKWQEQRFILSDLPPAIGIRQAADHDDGLRSSAEDQLQTPTLTVVGSFLELGLGTGNHRSRYSFGLPAGYGEEEMRDVEAAQFPCPGAWGDSEWWTPGRLRAYANFAVVELTDLIDAAQTEASKVGLADELESDLNRFLPAYLDFVVYASTEAPWGRERSRLARAERSYGIADRACLQLFSLLSRLRKNPAPQQSTRPRNQKPWLPHALLALRESPNLSDRALGAMVGVAHTTIGREPTIQALRRNQAGQVPTGQRDSTLGGGIEAEDG